MAKRRAAQQRVREAESPPADRMGDDTALRALTDEERAALSMDAWEPSLLRAMLQAENRLPPKRRR